MFSSRTDIRFSSLKSTSGDRRQGKKDIYLCTSSTSRYLMNISFANRMD